ncbi:bifunctional diaminohydroxyphosphoribosylaminopyrimidine deaminase/5-amino-6-(5-phosphoribosylamino)uracil reductase RibD [Hymenobacter taeanensis]|uniref:Riboflavin biosynthesis protein RibD n=1 Tax=Hymenobacter taeanensis TaxID=2735321 RepID=A0A6M6BIL9_9BACT|nr:MULTISPECIES: bifunctional diaminohydroxyphosphoribosylaminopyrimidine deaminase/5-amino-6-(5-phosphoribosylamino)uracil reductase RibD [Hymenobacter]QJX46905.1 bifunctional diaminohydroxyphosphoribosylaminopyrimidine deaminase/5-amino-6-(5-phosphoribosylamino)uracil reductase RibD [Hymenobacter taeanensis]UOQ80778.1 bifunctional diaminohydroxyphosphoribosylaminopyrimidine deaminase/5-amino-6-(5-phosphoribosylamino)uracil reductase RibD [Hymenobacter sp. 5414T-23]
MSATDFDHLMMRRALDLARLGTGYARPNPIVGCVITHKGRIIGEGWHQQYGGPHAEVNAVASVTEQDLLPQSRVYVTLEPCSHYGKTPPCADLLIAKGVAEVVVCNLDPNPLVAGRGITKLREAGIAVETGLLEEEGRWLNRRFFTFQEKQRPYVVLKWAETADGYLAGPYFQPVAISGRLAQVVVHQWRTEEQAILVGTRTALHDNPRLNVREWPGQNPIRLVIDKNLCLPPTHQLLDGSQPTIVYTYRERDATNNLAYEPLSAANDLFPQILHNLYERNVQSVLVEGGPTVLNSLLKDGLWDEARVIRSPKVLGGGVAAPQMGLTGLREQFALGEDEVFVYQRQALGQVVPTR